MVVNCVCVRACVSVRMPHSMSLSLGLLLPSTVLFFCIENRSIANFQQLYASFSCYTFPLCVCVIFYLLHRFNLRVFVFVFVYIQKWVKYTVCVRCMGSNYWHTGANILWIENRLIILLSRRNVLNRNTYWLQKHTHKHTFWKEREKEEWQAHSGHTFVFLKKIIISMR